MRLGHLLIIFVTLSVGCKSLQGSKKSRQQARHSDLIFDSIPDPEPLPSDDFNPIIGPKPKSLDQTIAIDRPEPGINDKTVPPNTPQSTPNNETIEIRFLSQADDKATAVPRSQVSFTIANQTGAGAWNTESNMVYADQGQDLIIINKDAVKHRIPSTSNSPCESTVDTLPGQSAVCRLDKPFDPKVDGPLYDTNYGENAKFWLHILPSVQKTLEQRCIGCHSGSRSEAGLDLLSWPPQTSSPSLEKAFHQRLQLNAPLDRRMPPSSLLIESERTALLRWASNGFPKPPSIGNGLAFTRSIRWIVLRDGKKTKEGMVEAFDFKVSYPNDQTKVVVRLEELIRGSWLLLKEQEIRTTGNANISIPMRSAVTPLATNIGIDDIVEFVKDSQIKKVEDLILALPEAFKRNYVLVRDTKSRHLADTRHPRLIMFSESARLLLGVSSHPDDPLRESVEMQEAMDDGTWKFRELSFRGPSAVVSQDDAPCKVCHGSRPRPIWGSYPNWPGALGDESGRVSPEEFKAIEDLVSGAVTRDRFAALSFSLRKDLFAFALPKRYYNFSNTVMNIILGRRAAYQLYRREIVNPVAKKEIFHQILIQECKQPDHSVDSPVNWTSLVTPHDLALHRSMKDGITENDRHWNESGVGLEELVLFFGLMDLIEINPTLNAMFKPVLQQLQTYVRLTNGKEELGLDLPLLHVRPRQYIYPRILGDLDGKSVATEDGPSLSAKRSEFCSIVETYFKSL